MSGIKSTNSYVQVPKFKGLRKIMKARGLTPEKVAGLTQGEVSSVTIRNILAGRHAPSTLTLTYIGRGLRAPVHKLL